MSPLLGLYVALSLIPGQERPRFTHTWRLEGHAKGVTGVAFSPDNRTLASTGFDGYVRVWSLETGKQLYSLDERPRWAYSPAFLPDGKTLLVLSDQPNETYSRYPGRLAWWDLKTRKVTRVLPFEDRARWLLLSPNGKTLVTPADKANDLTLKLRDSATGKVLVELNPVVDNAITFTPDSKQLLLMGERWVYVYDVSTGKEVRTLRVRRGEGGGDGLAISPDGKTLATSFAVFDFKTGKVRARLADSERAEGAWFIRRGTWVLRAGVGLTVHDRQTGERVRRTASSWQWSPPRSVAISPHERWLAFPSEEWVWVFDLSKW